MRKTLRNIMAEYGAVAVVVYLTLFALVLGGFWAAFRFGFGWRPTGVAAAAGTFTAAYLATKVTQPLRIGATLVLTPFVARLYERVTGRPAGRPVAAAGERPPQFPRADG